MKLSVKPEVENGKKELLRQSTCITGLESHPGLHYQCLA